VFLEINCSVLQKKKQVTKTRERKKMTYRTGRIFKLFEAAGRVTVSMFGDMQNLYLGMKLI